MIHCPSSPESVFCSSVFSSATSKGPWNRESSLKADSNHGYIIIIQDMHEVTTHQIVNLFVSSIK